MQTDRCIIEVLKQTDYTDVKELYFNNQVRTFLGGVATEERYDKCFKEMMDINKDAFYLVIRLIDTHEFIGLVSIDIHHDGINKELSYQFLPSYWGRGYALEAISEIIYHAFNKLGIQRIVSETQSENKASCNLLNRLGMKIIDKIYRFNAEQYIFAIDSAEYVQINK